MVAKETTTKEKEEEMMDRGFQLGIVGSRLLTDYGLFKTIVDEWIAAHGIPDAIVSGGASGVDSLAWRYAHEHNIEMIVFKPNPRLPSPQRYHDRNKDIVDNSCHVLAFPSERVRGRHVGRDYAKTYGGTQFTMRYADQQEVPLHINWMEDLL